MNNENSQNAANCSVKKESLSERYHCTFEGCCKVYSRKDNLKIHTQKDHDVPNDSKTGRFECHFSGCDGRFYHATKLIAHYKDAHDFTIATARKSFPSWTAFLKWKEEEETITYASFVQPKGETSGSRGEQTRTVMYTCCRDGESRENKQPRKTALTRKCYHSRKLNSGFCISRMTATEHLKTGQVEVDYITTHTRHQPSQAECKYLPLPPSLRKEVQEKFAQGITIERIMDDIRTEVGRRTDRTDYSEQAKRKHFVTRQDLRNITRATRDYTRHRHSEDAISVDRMVTEMNKENPSPILAYKRQGFEDPNYPNLPEESFLLVLMTGFQAQVFKEYADKIVCVDSTHKTNEYKFKLITLLVVDEYRRDTNCEDASDPAGSGGPQM